MRILLISAHTDDGELNCGGSILKLKKGGNEIFWQTLSDAASSAPDGYSMYEEQISIFQEYKIQGICERFPVRRFQQKRQDILEAIRDYGNYVQPDLIFIPSCSNWHQDHEVVANECLRAYKNFNCNIISYLSFYDRKPNSSCNVNFFISLTLKELHEKIRMINHYKSQIFLKRPYFQPNRVHAEAETYGIMCNSKYAEGFSTIRWMII